MSGIKLRMLHFRGKPDTPVGAQKWGAKLLPDDRNLNFWGRIRLYVARNFFDYVVFVELNEVSNMLSLYEQPPVGHAQQLPWISGAKNSSVGALKHRIKTK